MIISLPFGLEVALFEDEEDPQPTYAECVVHELSKPKNANIAAKLSQRGIFADDLDPSILPNEYNDISFGSHKDRAKGDTVTKLVHVKNGNPISCRTVGEYKKAQEKTWFQNGMGGWHD